MTNNKKDNNQKSTEKIIELIESIRPFLNMEGGDLEFVKYEDKILYIKLSGACQTCMFQDSTIQNGIYETIKEEVPELEKVINVDI